MIHIHLKSNKTIETNAQLPWIINELNKETPYFFDLSGSVFNSKGDKIFERSTIYINKSEVDLVRFISKIQEE